jgi:predicted negative regulator of RcsB-dependent stress response
LQGDLLVAAKRPAEARTAFEKARELGNLSPLLELKINDLPASP